MNFSENEWYKLIFDNLQFILNRMNVNTTIPYILKQKFICNTRPLHNLAKCKLPLHTDWNWEVDTCQHFLHLEEDIPRNMI